MSIKKITYKTDYENIINPLARYAPAYDFTDSKIPGKKIVAIPVQIDTTSFYLINEIKREVKKNKDENEYFSELLENGGYCILTLTFKTDNEQLDGIDCTWVEEEDEDE